MKKRHRSILNYFRPSIYLPNFEHLNIFALKNHGIRILYCDLDNTLVPHFTRKPTENVIKFLKRLKDQNISVWIVSNNVKKRVKEFCQELMENKIISGFIANAKKPLVMKIKKNMKVNKFYPEDIVFLGDQLITDVFAANLLGCKSILVRPLMDVAVQQKTGNKKIQNLIERLIYNRLEVNNFLNIGDLNEEFVGGSNEIL